MTSSAAATFAAVFVTLYVSHQVADHWVQTEHQAATKGGTGWPARLACARHVGSYVVTAAVLLAAIALLLPLSLSVLGVAIGQAVSGVTHYWADRRFTLRALASAAGHEDFYRLGTPRPDRDDNPSLGTGAYALDQSFHVFWLFVAALCTALI